MRLKDFEEKVMDLKIIGLRILSFRIFHSHVKRCLARETGGDVWIWDKDGNCYTHHLSLNEVLMDDNDFVERFDYASVKGWTRREKYDIR
jgi:hypothetical protein